MPTRISLAIKRSVHFFRENRQDLVVVTVCTLISGVALANYSVPLEKVPQWISTVVQNLGLIAVVLYSSVRTFVDNSVGAIGTVVKSWIKGFAGCAVALWAIGAYGDMVFNEVMAKPQEAAALAVALLIIREIIRFAYGNPYTGIALTPAKGMVEFGQSPGKSIPTERDNRTTATHEAGHAMVCAALQKLPANFVAVVAPDARDSSFGHVSAVREGHMITSKTFAEWQMHMLLGGLAAERFLLREETLGGCSDYSKWLSVAKAYLANGTRGVFYTKPGSEVEEAHNNCVLKQLQREQELLLATFFEMNVDVLATLSDALLEQRQLDAQALAPFMARVAFPEGLPRPGSNFQNRRLDPDEPISPD